MILRRLLPAAALGVIASLAAMERPPAPRETASPTPATAASPATAFPSPPPALELPPEPGNFTDAPDGGGIKVDYGYQDTDEPVLSRYTELTVQFPDAMVPPERIDATDGESPFTVWPPLDTKWVWRTQSSGTLSVNGPLVPGETYLLQLRAGAADLAGKPLPVDAWGVAIPTAELALTTDYSERERLSARPQVTLSFNYPIRLHDAAEGCWFQDRLTRERFPAEVLLNRAAGELTDDTVDVPDASPFPAPSDIRVRPRDPLPVGRFYDLVVEHVADAYAGRTLPYPEVIPLGRTFPLTVDFLVARNWAAEKPHVEVKFTDTLGEAPLPANALVFDPPVANLRFLKEGQFLRADGDFDPAVRYRVSVAPGIVGERGYATERPETWGATFRAKPATLTFPAGRTFRQRSSLGLRFALLQANTGPVTWRLARIPLERYAEIQGAPGEDSRPVIDARRLPVVASGEIPAATDDEEIVRTIEWRPGADAPPLSGPHLLEATARDADGKTIANHAFVFFNEVVFTQKRSPQGAELRLARMNDAEPIANVRVALLTDALIETAAVTTDAQGRARFPAAALAGTSFYRADLPTGPAFELTGTTTPFPGTGSTYASAPAPYLGTIITDRPLYRPGEELKFKGYLRKNEGAGRLAVPTGAEIRWEIVSVDQNERVGEGRATINAFGAWDGSWTAPAQGRLGSFKVVARLGSTEVGGAGYFRIDEFRNPPFSVVCEPAAAAPEGVSSVEVSSEYFHGAPNVGSTVKWTATWISDSDGDYYNDADADGFLRVDLYSEQRRAPAFEMEVSGETQLDGKGRAVLISEPPFNDPGLRARCTVNWRVDVTGPDGQTITGGATETVVMNPVTLGVRAEDAPAGRLAFRLQALAREAGVLTAIAPAPQVQAELFLVQTKSVKERLAPFVFRYRNTDVFVPVESRTVPAEGELAFTPKTPGRYVLVVRPLPGDPGIIVSAEAYLAGEGESELPVTSEQALTLRPVHGDRPVPAGERAAFDLLSPGGAGIAWITVETDRVLESFSVAVPGNTTRVEVPVVPGYAPGVHVSAYLLRPGGSDGLPGEMYGATEVAVSAPAAAIDLAITSDKAEYEPRQTGRLTVQATAQGRPVADAEVALYAVDDAILELGGWMLPGLLSTFQPAHPFSVVTYAALNDYVDHFSEKSLTQKGYVVGSGGKDEFGSSRFVRQDFRPLILWLPSLRTDAKGLATAEFQTPDNLTRFRVIGLAQSKADQFGAGDTTFTVSRPLLIEPALPRFLRAGDEVELRAVARQKFADSAAVTITCEPADGLELTGPATVERPAARNEPAVATFRARVAANATRVPIRFSVRAEGAAGDEVEVTLPVAPQTIEVRETVAGRWSGAAFEPARQVPAGWLRTAGTADITLSTSPYLPQLLGIPTVLDYPYGCFEQKSSRLLVYTSLAELLAFLPEPTKRRENFARVIRETLDEFERSLLPDDMLPYWPFGTEGNVFVTIQAAWAVAQAQEAGIEVPDNLANALPRALGEIVLRRTRLEVSPALRAFALFVLSELQDGPDEEITAAAGDLFLHRDRLDDEARAFLALALGSWEIEPERQATLLAELPAQPNDRAFNPVTFSSAVRAEAIITAARLALAPESVDAAARARLEKRILSAPNLSTQENLWLLVAFDALLSDRPPAKLTRLTPPADATAENGSAAAWTQRDLTRLASLVLRGSAKGGTFAVAARRALPPDEQRPVANGLRIERIVKNLTDPARTGTAEAPLALGDQVLISFRFGVDQDQAYVALEDALPAGLEVVNPNLAMVGRFYRIPDDPGFPAAWLSFSEMRDRQTNLFFDRLDAGSHSYAILARATAAGTFAWPSAQITPMYDARVYGRSAASTCVVRE